MSSVSMYHTSRNATGPFLFRDLAEKTKNPAKILVKTYDGPLWWSHNETVSPELAFTDTVLALSADRVGLSSFAYRNSCQAINFTTSSGKKLYSARCYVSIVQCHSRSSITVLIESLYATSYWSSIVPICLSSIVSEAQRYTGRKSAFYSPFLPTTVSFEAIASVIPWPMT